MGKANPYADSHYLQSTSILNSHESLSQHRYGRINTKRKRLHTAKRKDCQAAWHPSQSLSFRFVNGDLDRSKRPMLRRLISPYRQEFHCQPNNIFKQQGNSKATLRTTRDTARQNALLNNHYAPYPVSSTGSRYSSDSSDCWLHRSAISPSFLHCNVHFFDGGCRINPELNHQQ